MAYTRKSGVITSDKHVLIWGINALKRGTARNLIIKLVFQACIYHIWKEQNRRTHTQVCQSGDSIILIIIQDIASRIQSLPALMSVYVTAKSYLLWFLHTMGKRIKTLDKQSLHESFEPCLLDAKWCWDMHNNFVLLSSMFHCWGRVLLWMVPIERC